MKYHPKNDSSAEATEKFNDLGKAYNLLTSELTSREQDQFFNSIFSDFDKEIDSFFKPLEQISNKP